jgi:hypothetical protein
MMIRKIKLTENLARLSNREPFLLPGVLTFKFEHKGYDLTNAFIHLKNGEKEETFRFTNPFVIPKEFLFTGDLYYKIDMYINDVKSKEWSGLPLRLQEIDGGVQALDIVYELEKKLENSVSKKEYNELLNTVNDLITKHNELIDTVNAIKENY